MVDNTRERPEAVLAPSPIAAETVAATAVADLVEPGAAEAEPEGHLVAAVMEEREARNKILARVVLALVRAVTAVTAAL